MTTGFLPRLAEQRTDRAKFAAALALLQANPGVPVIYIEEPRTNNLSQQSVAGRLSGLSRSHPELRAYTRVGIDGVVRGFLVLPVAEVTEPVAEPEPEDEPQPEVYDITGYTPAPSGRTGDKQTRTRATKQTRNHSALKRIVEADGYMHTVSGWPLTTNSLTDARKSAERRRSSLIMFARSKNVRIKTKVAVTPNAVRLDAKLLKN